MSKPLLRALICAIALATSVPAAHAATASPSDAVRRVYAAFATRDARVLDELSGVRRLRRRIEVRCLAAENVVIESTVIHSSHATVYASALVHDFDASSVDIDHAHVELERTRGVWRIRTWMAEEDELADAIAHAEPAKRRALLAANQRLLTPRFARELAKRAVDATNVGTEPARALNALASDVADAVGDVGAQSVVLVVQSILLREAELKPEAVDVARRAVALAEGSRDPDLIAIAYNTLGRNLTAFDQYSPETKLLFDHAAALAPRVTDPKINARSYSNLGVWLGDRRNDFASLAAYKSVLAIATAENDRVGIAGALEDIGLNYQNQNQDAVARAYFERSIRYSLGTYFEPMVRVALTDLYIKDHDIRAAVAMWPTVVASTNRVGGIANRAGAALIEGELRQMQRRYKEAEEAFARCDALDREAGFAPLSVLPRLLEEEHKYDRALRVALDYAAANRGKEPAEFVDDLGIAARANRVLGNPDAALAELREAVATAETHRDEISATAQPGTGAFEQFFTPHSELADLLLELGRTDEALHISELGKARMLLDLAQNGRRDLSKLITADERQKESALRDRIAELNLTLANASPHDAAAARAKIGDAQREYDLFESALYVRYPRLRTLRSAPEIPDGNAIAAGLPADAAYLELNVSKDAVDTFIITRAGTTGLRTTISVERLRRMVERYARALAKRDLTYRKQSRALYDLLFGKAAAKLTGIRRVTIVPSDALWRVPFESLLDRRGHYLIERFAIEYTPSVAVQFIRDDERAAPKRLLACGDPAVAGRTRRELEAFYRGVTLGRLPDAADEARQIARMYGDGAAALIGPRATEGEVKSIAPSYDILHFATHAILDNNNPMYSRLVLAPDPATGDDGMLHSWEITDLDLHAKLVVLSACDTASGRIGAGEGLVGMAWAFFVAGARATVASHWAVASAATRDLMVRFHQSLHDHDDPARALRDAKLAMLAHARYRHPFYWAGFVLISRDR